MNVAVNRLTLRGACDAPHHQAFLIEDALNTQLSGESRLVLVRTLSLLPVGPQDRRERDNRFMVADRVANSWTRVMAGACHGGGDGAAAANTVWFHDAAEAKAILLARLIKGQSVDGWFWKLAVTLWQGQPLADWIADELLADPPAGPESGATALLIRLLAERQFETAEAAIWDYVQRNVEPGWFAGRATSSNFDRELPEPTLGVLKANLDQMDRDQSHWLANVAAGVQAALPAGLTTILQRLYSQASQQSALEVIAGRFVARAAPELQLHPKMLHLIAQHILRRTILSALPANGELPTPSKSKGVPNPATLMKDQPNFATPSRKDVRKQHETAPVDKQTQLHKENASSRAAADPPIDEPIASIMLSERHSTAAGLFFVINVLRVLDWPAWLAARPEHLACNPTAQLLQYIALHHRVDPSDAALAFLTERLADQEPMEAEQLCLWRKAIDRWLVRNTHMKLSSLVKRRGWLHWHDDRLAVRFPMQDIDLRLRRLALDRDPGWVDWAGITLRFHFSDQPILADGLPGNRLS